MKVFISSSQMDFDACVSSYWQSSDAIGMRLAQDLSRCVARLRCLTDKKNRSGSLSFLAKYLWHMSTSESATQV
jgi:hypothetical protein